MTPTEFAIHNASSLIRLGVVSDYVLACIIDYGFKREKAEIILRWALMKNNKLRD